MVCTFTLAWIGRCNKPTADGWDERCSEHKGILCVSCGAEATGDCGQTMGPMTCGFMLCDTCAHSDPGKFGHARKRP